MAKKPTYEQLKQKVKKLEKEAIKPKQAEEALKQSENKYRILLEHIPQKIFHKDKDSVYVSCNENYARDLKIKAEEIVGKTDYEFFPKKLAEKYRADDKRIIELRKTEEIEEKYIQDGQERWVQTVKTPIKDEEGNITGVLGIFWDITDHKQTEEALRESEDKFRSISTSAKDAIVMMDNDGNVSYWNPAAEKMFGHTMEEVIGKQLHTLLVPERYHEAYREGFSAFKETGRGSAVGKTLELEGVRKDGTEFLVELSMNAIRIKDQWHAVGIMRDITKRKQAEEDLKRTHDQLEEANKKLGFAYAQMRDWRDRLGTQLHAEEIGLLIDENGQILSVTEKTPEGIGRSRIELLKSNIADLVDKDSMDELKNDMKRSLAGIFCKRPVKIIKKESGYQVFEVKMMRLSPVGTRMLLVLMRESDKIDNAET